MNEKYRLRKEDPDIVQPMYEAMMISLIAKALNLSELETRKLARYVRETYNY